MKGVTERFTDEDGLSTGELIELLEEFDYDTRVKLYAAWGNKVRSVATDDETGDCVLTDDLDMPKVM